MSASSFWPAPIANDHKSGYAGEEVLSKNSRPLREFAVSMWCAPTVACATGGQMTRGGDRSGELLLTGQAVCLSSRLGPTTTPAGVRCSETGRSLNRLFVAWLMGWPIAPSIYASSVTELSLYRARMRCAFLQLGSPPEAPPAQLSLFG